MARWSSWIPEGCPQFCELHRRRGTGEPVYLLLRPALADLHRGVTLRPLRDFGIVRARVGYYDAPTR
jgi:hypothetical protein